MKHRIRLTEGQLHRIIRTCVNEALNEIGDTDRGQFALGQLSARQAHRDGNKRKAFQTSEYAQDADETQYDNDLKSRSADTAKSLSNNRNDAFTRGRNYGTHKYMR